MYRVSIAGKRALASSSRLQYRYYTRRTTRRRLARNTQVHVLCCTSRDNQRSTRSSISPHRLKVREGRVEARKRISRRNIDSPVSERTSLYDVLQYIRYACVRSSHRLDRGVGKGSGRKGRRDQRGGGLLQLQSIHSSARKNSSIGGMCTRGLSRGVALFVVSNHATIFCLSSFAMRARRDRTRVRRRRTQIHTYYTRV